MNLGFTPIPTMTGPLADLFERLIRIEGIVDQLTSHNIPKDDPYFEDIWAAWPTHRSDGKPAKGNKAKAYRAYLKCICQKYTPEILTEAVGYYLNSLEEREGYVQMVATFFGRNKQTWKEYADKIREAQ